MNEQKITITSLRNRHRQARRDSHEVGSFKAWVRQHYGRLVSNPPFKGRPATNALRRLVGW